MLELCQKPSRGGQRVIYSTNLTRCDVFPWMEKYDCPDRKWVRSGVKRGLLKTKWKRVERVVSRSRQKKHRFYRASARARVCVRPRGAEGPTQSSNICITRTGRKIKGQECEKKTRHVIAGKGMNFSHGDRVYLKSVSRFFI